MSRFVAAPSEVVWGPIGLSARLGSCGSAAWLCRLSVSVPKSRAGVAWPVLWQCALCSGRPVCKRLRILVMMRQRY